MPDSSEPLRYTPFAVLVFVATTDTAPKRPRTFPEAAATRLTDLVTVLFGEQVLDHHVGVTVLG
jgi:hypothetical protein